MKTNQTPRLTALMCINTGGTERDAKARATIDPGRSGAQETAA